MSVKIASAIVLKGHGVASGRAFDSPYPKGTIEMQKPYFFKRGLDLSHMHAGTLNLLIEGSTFELFNPQLTFKSITWAEGFPAEDFSFSPCEIVFERKAYKGFVYFPHPETKIGHFQPANIIEVISEFIPTIKYGDEVTLKYNGNELRIIEG